MIRPMAVLGCSVLGALAICGLFGSSFAFYTSFIALIIFFVAVFVKKLRVMHAFKYICAIALCVCISCACFTAVSVCQVAPLYALDGETAVITATIEEIQPMKNGKYVYVLKTQQTERTDMPQSFRLRFTGKMIVDALPGNQVRFRAHFYSLDDQNAKGSRYYAENLYIGAYTLEEVELLSAKKRPFQEMMFRMRSGIKRHLEETAPPAASELLTVMLLGDSSQMGTERKQDFQRSGIGHLFSVSGLHVTLWSHAVLFLLRKLHCNRRLQYGAGIVSTLFYMALTGFSFSTVRAGIMLILYFTARLIRRDADALNSLGMAAFVISCTSPFVGYDAGLLLSFSATLGILLLGRKWNQQIVSKPMKRMLPMERKIVRWICSSLSITLSALVFAFPVQILFFEEFSLASPLVNLLTIVPATLFMIGGGVAALFAAVPFLTWLSTFCFLALNIIADYLLEVSRFFAQLDGLIVPIHSLPVFLWTAVSVILFAGAYFWRKYSRAAYRVTALISAVLLVLCVMVTLADRQIPKLVVCDVGDGTAILVTQGGRGAMIGCGGDDYAFGSIRTQLIRNSVRSLDMVLLPRSTQAESNAFDAVAGQYPVSGVIYPLERKEMVITDDGSVPVLRQNSGSIVLWDSITIAFENNCVYVTSGQFSALILPKPTVKLTDIPAGWRNAQVLITKEPPKYAFQGCSPETILFSTSERAWDLSGLEIGSGAVLCTGQVGTITVLTEASGYRIRSEYH